MQVADTAAIVTGGASGLGAATAAALAAQGASVFALDLEPAIAGAPMMSGVTYLAADVTDADSVRSAIDAAAGSGVPLRIVVNCAGIGPSARASSARRACTTLHLYAKVIQVNLIGTFNGAGAGRRAHRQDRGGRRWPTRGHHQHRLGRGLRRPGRAGRLLASKGGIVGMTLPAARDLAQSASGSARSPRASSTPRCSPPCRTSSAPPWQPGCRSRSGSAPGRVRQTGAGTSSTTTTSTARPSGWTARCGWLHGRRPLIVRSAGEERGDKGGRLGASAELGDRLGLVNAEGIRGGLPGRPDQPLRLTERGDRPGGERAAHSSARAGPGHRPRLRRSGPSRALRPRSARARRAQLERPRLSDGARHQPGEAAVRTQPDRRVRRRGTGSTRPPRRDRQTASRRLRRRPPHRGPRPPRAWASAAIARSARSTVVASFCTSDGPIIGGGHRGEVTTGGNRLGCRRTPPRGRPRRPRPGGRQRREPQPPAGPRH